MTPWITLQSSPFLISFFVFSPTSSFQGAKVANHVKVMHLLKEESADASSPPRIVGAHVTDTLTGESWDIRAKYDRSHSQLIYSVLLYDFFFRGVISAVGAMADLVRKMEDPNVKEVSRHTDCLFIHSNVLQPVSRFRL